MLLIQRYLNALLYSQIYIIFCWIPFPDPIIFFKLQQRCTWLTFCQKMEGWVGTCFTMANTFFNIFSTNFYKIFILGRFVCFTIHTHSIYLKWVWLFCLFFLYIYYTMMMSYRLIFWFFVVFCYAYLLNSNDVLQADIQTQSYDQG